MKKETLHVIYKLYSLRPCLFNYWYINVCVSQNMFSNSHRKIVAF